MQGLPEDCWAKARRGNPPPHAPGPFLLLKLFGVWLQAFPPTAITADGHRDRVSVRALLRALVLQWQRTGGGHAAASVNRGADQSPCSWQRTCGRGQPAGLGEPALRGSRTTAGRDAMPERRRNPSGHKQGLGRPGKMLRQLRWEHRHVHKLIVIVVAALFIS